MQNADETKLRMMKAKACARKRNAYGLLRIRHLKCMGSYTSGKSSWKQTKHETQRTRRLLLLAMISTQSSATLLNHRALPAYEAHLWLALKSHSRTQFSSILDATSPNASLSAADPHIRGILLQIARTASRGTARASSRARQHVYKVHIVCENWSDDTCRFRRASEMEPCEVQEYRGPHLHRLEPISQHNRCSIGGKRQRSSGKD